MSYTLALVKAFVRPTARSGEIASVRGIGNMFDARIRPFIGPPMDAAGCWLARRGVRADAMTIGGSLMGLMAAAAIAAGRMQIALVLIGLNRIADGLDGAIARATQKTDRGGYLDIVLDFAFYAAVPLAFAVHDPGVNALAAACLLAAFLLNGATFFAFALMAERRGLVTTAQGEKSLYYLSGLAEGGETFLVFIGFCLLPEYFPYFALAFAGLCGLSAAARIGLAWRLLG